MENARSNDEDFLRAKADLELVLAAFPDEVQISKIGNVSEDGELFSFPLKFEMHLKTTSDKDDVGVESITLAIVKMEIHRGYPSKSGIFLSGYRIIGSSKKVPKKHVEDVMSVIRQTSKECLENEEEGALSCCLAAQQVWDEFKEEQRRQIEETNLKTSIEVEVEQVDVDIDWITGKDDNVGFITDRKSTFQAFVCRINSEDMALRAVNNLISGNSKLQRATHNMFAYRFSIEHKNGNKMLVHDNDDDGEAGAGSKLAELLALRKEDGILVLVARWFGGIHLGPKRFLHISNCARELLVWAHSEGKI